MLHLPEDVLYIILSFGTPYVLARLARTAKRFRVDLVPTFVQSRAIQHVTRSRNLDLHGYLRMHGVMLRAEPTSVCDKRPDIIVYRTTASKTKATIGRYSTAFGLAHYSHVSREHIHLAFCDDLVGMCRCSVVGLNGVYTKLAKDGRVRRHCGSDESDIVLEEGDRIYLDRYCVRYRVDCVPEHVPSNAVVMKV